MSLRKFKKYFFYILYNFFAKHLPPSYSKFSFFAKKIRYTCAKAILKNIGENVNIEKGSIFSTAVEIGNNSGIGINCKLYGPVYIGTNVMMAPDVHIFTKNHRFERIDIPMSEQGSTLDIPVIIEDDVWIGARVTILPGVKISKGTIVAASSVVTKNTEEYSIVAGNPAKKIKSRI